MLNGHENNTYYNANKICDEKTEENTEYTNYLGFKIIEKEKTLPILHCIFKVHKNQTGARFINVSKICSTKQIFKPISNVFKVVYSQIENFHKNAKLLLNYYQFWVLQNSDPIIQS